MKGTLVEHLTSRGYDVARYKTQWLTDTQLTVPLFDFDHKLKGYQVYTPDASKHAVNPKEAKYFTRGLGKQLVWGLESEISINNNRLPTVFLTESVFKACALHRLGLNAWSVLGSTVSDALYHQLRLLPVDLVCCGDDDKAGKEFSETFGRGFVSHDLDELSPKELLYLTAPFL